MKNQNFEIKSSLVFGFVMYFVTFLLIMGLTALIVIFIPALNPNKGGSVGALLTTVFLSCFIVMVIPFYISIKLMKLWTEPKQPVNQKLNLLKN